MPLKVGRFRTSVFVISIGLSAASAGAQTAMPTASPAPVDQLPAAAAPVKLPTAADVMRERISKAKAYIAVRNYNAAIYELEGIRRESADQTVQSVASVLLMNSYLEQGDYKRAQELLNQSYAAVKANKPAAPATYFAIASQVVKGARSRVERYRSLGLSVADRTLPLEAVNDLEKMRETVELVVTQSKDAAQDRSRTSDAMALLEEATTSRSMMARDDYDARRWQSEVADTREQLASSRSVVLSAVNDGTAAEAASTPVTDAALRTPPATQTASQPAYVPTNQTPAPVNQNSNQPTYQPQQTMTPAATPGNGAAVTNPNNAATDQGRSRVVPNQPATNAAATNNNSAAAAPASNQATPSAGEKPKDSSPIQVGSLVAYATKQAQPVYPAAARTVRAAGLVRVDVTIDENGQVAAIERASGPVMLQDAAKDAIRKWRFKPFLRDGQPVRATGFVNFNFAL
ncbi:MAG: TonB family protein [Pyrinomonadaceae bacterium]